MTKDLSQESMTMEIVSLGNDGLLFLLQLTGSSLSMSVY